MDIETNCTVESFNEDDVEGIKKLESGMLLIPRRTDEGDLYPEHTSDLLKTLRGAHPNLKTEMSDSDALTESIHSADVIMPTIQFAVDVAIGVVSSIVSEIIVKFIESKIREGEQESTNTKLEIIIDEENGYKRITYNGPASELKELTRTIEKLK